MLRYNICFIRQGSRILLLNRNHPYWMGCWNGVGGKLEPGESPLQSMKREIAEETGLIDCALTYKGLVTWTSDGAELGGMYLYLGELPEAYPYPTPVKTAEGILDWKPLDWILHPDNQGISANIPIFLEKMLHDDGCYDYRCTYRDDKLAEHRAIPIEASTEERERTNEYLASAGSR